MHPAFSVVFFTTASGAGYGLLFLAGLFAAAGVLPPDPVTGFVTLGLALGLVTAGLLSSTAHLGHPERAWRAFSQWRTSWLSREGVASVATYVPAGLFGLGWVVLGRTDGWVAAAGLLAAAGAAVTVVTTGMIYASLKPVAQWHSRYTVPGYLLYALMSGAVLMSALLHTVGTGEAAPPAAMLAPPAILAGWAWKTLTWRHDDALGLPADANSATGLAGGTVRSVEWPHTQENYLLKEMGYHIARKHAAKLRIIVLLCAFALPLALSLVVLTGAGVAAAIAAAAAVPVMAVGLVAERWLFFAQARHTVTLYYGLDLAG